MPIHLPPISRREFFKRSALAGAALALAPKALAASRRTDADSWALLADTHIAADRDKFARGVNLVQHFQQAAGEVLDLSRRPAGVFIVGDCAFNSGETADYEQVARLLDPLRAGELPIHIALGNHDNRKNIRAALKETQGTEMTVPDKHASLVRAKEANWFMLDSLEATNQTPGLLGATQLSWLAATLDENPKKPAILLIHHHPGAKDASGVLKDTEALFEIIRPRRQVKAWIFGHTHKWRVEKDESGVHLINLPPVAYPFDEKDPTGWVHAMLRSDGMRLELRCFNAMHKNQGQTVNLEWRSA